MTNDERRFRRKSLAAVGIGIVASVALLSLLYMVGTHRCLDKTLGFGQETMVFLKNACEKYDRYEQEEKPRRRTIWMRRSSRLRRSCRRIDLKSTTIWSRNMSIPRAFRECWSWTPMVIWSPITISTAAIHSCCGERSWPVRRSHRCIEGPKFPTRPLSSAAVSTLP